MSKIRVYELAKELKLTSKELIAILFDEFGISVKNHMSVVEEEDASLIKEIMNDKNKDKEKEEVRAKGKVEGRDKDQEAIGKKEKVAESSKEEVEEEKDQVSREESSKKATGKGKKKSKDLIDLDEDEDEIEVKAKVKAKGPIKGTAKKGQDTSKPNIIEIYEEELNDKVNKQAKKKKKGRKQEEVKEEVNVEIITMGETITVGELADKIAKPHNEVIKTLLMAGVMAGVNQEIDFETASKVAEKYNVMIDKEEAVEFEDIDDAEIEEENLVKRPPVVTVMGHVDHGKTSLLDAIRHANIASGEAGGITQHIGAYTVNVSGEKVTFLDTPGHEAFTQMRARGSQITDIVILVVAGDDGIMPQTKESISHIKAAGVPVIVAINKMDKPQSNADKVKQELTEYGLICEEWGGDTVMVEVSAKKNMNIDKLLEMVILTAEMLELKADPERRAKGTVIEAKLDKGKGTVATLLVQNGTLRVGDSIIAGTAYGRIRAMFDDKGKKIKQAGPSIPVEVLGLSDVPGAGDKFNEVKDEKTARSMAESRIERLKGESLSTGRMSLEDLYSQISTGQVRELPIIVKADVQGSVEALKGSLEKLSTDEVKVRVIHGAAGAINETDVTLATASNAIIMGFNVRPDANAAAVAEKEGVEIKNYRVIYTAIEDVKAAMIGMLQPDVKEVVQGQAEIRQIYKISNVGTIAGAHVISGKITRSSQIRLIRDGIVIFEGVLASLKRFKDDAKEVAQGYECGFSIDKYNDIKEGDIVEAFIMEEVKRKEL